MLNEFLYPTTMTKAEAADACAFERRTCLGVQPRSAVKATSNDHLGAVAEDDSCSECGGLGNFHQEDCIYKCREEIREG